MPRVAPPTSWNNSLQGKSFASVAKRRRSCYAAINYHSDSFCPRESTLVHHPKWSEKSLPLELYGAIMEFTSIKDILRLCLVSKEFQKLVYKMRKTLDLRLVADRVNDHVMYSLSTRFLSIEVLMLDECINLTDKSCEYLSSWTALRNISFCNCSSLSDEGFWNLSKLEQLEELDFSGCTRITDRTSLVLRQLKKLHTIKFVFNKRITDETLFHLSKLPNLTSLSCIYCFSISDEGIKYLTNVAGTLQVLSLWFCPKISDKSSEAIASLKRLQVLDVAECHNLTDSFVERISGSNFQMTSLNLSGCSQITNQSILSISSCLQNLIHLNLANCHQITSKGIEELVGLKNLACLNAMNCSHVTDFAVHFTVIQ
jgi:F-box/leucine-rich repeat protein 2/20